MLFGCLRQNTIARILHLHSAREQIGDLLSSSICSGYTVMRFQCSRPLFLLFSICFFWRLVIRGVSSARRNELRRTNHRRSATGTLTADEGGITISWGQNGAASRLKRSSSIGAATTAVGGEGCIFVVVSRIFCQYIFQQPQNRAINRPLYNTAIKTPRAHRIKMTSYYCCKASPQGTMYIYEVLSSWLLPLD